jgi:2-phospho-L-lactate guanylyltransferase
MWHVVVPLKGWAGSKSRLALPEAVRRQMVQAMAADTLAALTSCPEVESLSVLVRDHQLLGGLALPGIDSIVAQPETAPSLDAALTWYATTRTAQGPLAVVVADLPALTVASLSEVLRQAQQHRFAMVADHSGTGTTVLTTLAAADLDPRFGPCSAAAHQAAGAALLTGPADVACDVDTLADLAKARLLGVGPQTATALADSAVSAWLG